LIGFLNSSATIDGVTVKIAAIEGNADVGGLIGLSSAGNLNIFNTTVNKDMSGNLITGRAGDFLGGLIGELKGSNNIIKNSQSSLDITSTYNSIGGLIGSVSDGGSVDISNSFATGTMTGVNIVGGLIGSLNGNLSNLSNVYATGSVTGAGALGGLVGYSNNANYVSTYATGIVNINTTTLGAAGGLIGVAIGTLSISKSFATGDVLSTSETGGLVGYINTSSTVSISESYSSGAVKGTSTVGGLVGFHSNGTLNIVNSYSTSSVKGTGSSIGGLVGSIAAGNVKDSYSTGYSVPSSGNNRGTFIGSINNNTTVTNYFVQPVAIENGIASLGGTPNPSGSDAARKLEKPFDVAPFTDRGVWDNSGDLPVLVNTPRLAR